MKSPQKIHFILNIYSILYYNNNIKNVEMWKIIFRVGFDTKLSKKKHHKILLGVASF